MISEAVRHGAPARAQPGIAAGEMHVWHAWLDQPAAVVEHLHGLLAADERARAARFHFASDRERYIVGRGVLRSLLGAYTARAPGELEFRYGAFDKPQLVGAGPQFNVSHSGAVALFAFVDGVEVGVDVELEGGEEFPRDRIAERFFSPAEVRALRSLPAHDRPRAFLRCWTRKEAFIKARGDGLSLPLDSFDVTLAPEEAPALLRTAWSDAEPPEWWLEDLSDPARSYVAAVALRGRAPRLVTHDVADDILSARQPRRRSEPSMEDRPAGAAGGLRTMRRKAVETTNLIETGFLAGHEDSMPLVITPAVDNVDLPQWCATHKDEIDGYLDRYGAILFRGFDLTDAPDFEAVASAVVPDLFADYGDLPPEEAGQRIYGVTPYPPDKMILFHNESSHLSSWPLRQFFFCVYPAPERGETPLLDCRAVCDALDPEILEQFAEKGLMYVRNFSEGIDVPWQDFFHTDDRAEVERTCADAGMSCEWTADGLRVRQVTKGVRNHPRTGERIFFNQVQLHHVSCLDDETRTALRQLFSDEDLPRNVHYGDGTPIPDETITRIGEIYEELCVEFPWQPGDFVAVDNMIVSHARRPYSGDRKHLVAMGEMVHAED